VLVDFGETRFAKAANSLVVPLKLREFIQTIYRKGT